MSVTFFAAHTFSILDSLLLWSCRMRYFYRYMSADDVDFLGGKLYSGYRFIHSQKTRLQIRAHSVNLIKECVPSNYMCLYFCVAFISIPVF